MESRFRRVKFRERLGEDPASRCAYLPSVSILFTVDLTFKHLSVHSLAVEIPFAHHILYETPQERGRPSYAEDCEFSPARAVNGAAPRAGAAQSPHFIG